MLIIMYNLNHFYKLTLLYICLSQWYAIERQYSTGTNDYPNRNEPRNDRDACKSDVVVGLETFGMLP